ncbi:MAG: polysaccharide deacetylase family protein [Actinomycetota bacterium]|nr:polysaccharide deacetylase family protein [Actinomycetota bacterium]
MPNGNLLTLTRAATGSARLLGRRALYGARARCVRALLQLEHVQEHLDRTAANVALTFDDGPDPDHTPAILDELARLSIAATFFLVGRRAQAHPRIVQRILAEGHEVGSHSSSHPEPWAVSLATLVGEYRRGRAQVEHAAERAVPLFRPPKGYVNGTGALAMLAARVRPWLWTIDPGDWTPEVRPEEIVAGVADLQAGDVVLLHDAIEGPLAPSALDRRATAAALEGIAEVAAGRGLHFTKLA